MPARDSRADNTIWMFWYQGIDRAPRLVRECVSSWSRQNPRYEIVILDQASMFDYVKREEFLFPGFDALSVQVKADLVRLYLLSRYGGVWADATLYCVQPLDHWLHFGAGSFFAYEDPAHDRLLSNWFLASREGDYIAATLYDRFRDYWMSNYRCRPVDYHSVLNRVLTHEWMRRYWFSFPVTRIARVYPYFVMHYLFERLLRTDPEFAISWQQSGRLPARPAIRLFRYGLGEQIPAELKQAIDRRESPVYKLDWKFDPAGAPASSTVLGYLLAHA